MPVAAADVSEDDIVVCLCFGFRDDDDDEDDGFDFDFDLVGDLILVEKDDDDGVLLLTLLLEDLVGRAALVDFGRRGIVGILSENNPLVDLGE
mmetsp:Transcript_31971/g.67052  ORF Transcript_31971/g.67052 Transcript_31971/m.67052 type:complete len:93 (-) Transcript_31971:46-324(-)